MGMGMTVVYQKGECNHEDYKFIKMNGNPTTNKKTRP